MNKVLIISDNHGLKKELELIKARHQVDSMVHCGDSELDYDISEMSGFHKVTGNCDLDSRYPNELMLEIAGLRFLIVHGHHHQVKNDLMTLSYAAEENQADVVCFGHTHIAHAEKIDELILINPGSVYWSKSSLPETYALVEWQTFEDLQVRYYTVDGELVREVDFNF